MKVTKTKLTLILLLLFFISFIFSLFFSGESFSIKEILQELANKNFDNKNMQILLNLRLPRFISAFLIGGSLSISGTIMQAITKNPIADSGLLGINAGASLGLVIAMCFFSTANFWLISSFSFLGALLSITMIILIQQLLRYQISSLQLSLIGLALASFFLSFTQLISLTSQKQQDLLFWTFGSLAGANWQKVLFLLPFIFIAIIITLFSSKQLTALRFGDDALKSLGHSPSFLRMILSLAVLFYTGASVAVAGSISFIGMMVPHFFRRFTRENYRSLLPLSFIGGGIFLSFADALSKIIRPPFESPVGAIVTLVAIPFVYQLFKKERSLG